MYGGYAFLNIIMSKTGILLRNDSWLKFGHQLMKVNECADIGWRLMEESV